MNDNALFFAIIIIVVFLIWFFTKSAAAKNSQDQRSKHVVEDKESAGQKRSELESELDELLQKIRTTAPDFILRARLDFEREYNTQNGDGMFGQEMSPLVCFGYRVGKSNGRIDTERKIILEYAVAADYDKSLPFLPADYRIEWGRPFSVTRFNRIHQHLNNMADLRSGRRNFEVAVSHWRADATWFHKTQLPRVKKFRAISF